MTADESSQVLEGFPRRVLRVAVYGSSVPVWVHGRTGRGEADYTQWLAEYLGREGLVADVANHAKHNQLVDRALCQFADTARATDVDVVVLHYGMAESWPKVLPWFVSRVFSTNHVHPGRGLRRLHKAAKRSVWVKVRRYQRRASAVVGQRTHRMSPKRFERETAAFVEEVRRELHALVLLVGVMPTTGRMAYSIPGSTERAERYDRILRAVAARHDENVRHIDVGGLIKDRVAELSPDGGHLSGEGHRLLGQRLAAEVLIWCPPSIYVRTRGDGRPADVGPGGAVAGQPRSASSGDADVRPIGFLPG